MLRRMITGDITELVDGAGDPALAVDGSHRIIAWNRAAEELLDYRAGEVLGRDCGQVLAGRNGDGHVVCNALCPFRLAVHREARLAALELQVRRKDGRAVWVRMASIILTGGEPCVIHILHDITDDRNREAFVRQVLQAASSLSADPPRAPAHGPPVLLSPRETEILRLLATGASTRSIAEALCISPATVRNHIQQIMHSLHAHSRLEAVIKALQRRIF